MALVTLQRSPSPSNDPDEESAEGGEDGSDGRSTLRHKRSKSTLERLRKIFSTVRFISKLRPCLSESYFTIKGAALILPHSENRKTSRKNHGGEIQRHLQSMLYLLRPEDKIKVAIRLEGLRDGEHRYMALVSTVGRQDTEESVILGLDCSSSPSTAHTPTPPATPTTPRSPPPTPRSPTTPRSPPPTPRSPTTPRSPNTPRNLAPPKTPTSLTSPTLELGASASGLSHGDRVSHGHGHGSATIGLVLPIWMGMKVRLSGDGGFSISLDEKSYLFKPVSVQAMWSAIQSLNKALLQAEQMKYLAEGLSHTWVQYYHSKVDTSNRSRLTTWNMMEDVEVFAPACLDFRGNNEIEKVKMKISNKLKEVMMSVDLDEATSVSLRKEVEAALGMQLDQYRSYFDEELIRILGQMDAPSQILPFLYLGSEWNASNLEELQKLEIKYILNVTREIDNFFQGMFQYYNVRLYDQEDSELLKHWPKTHRFINKAKKHGAKVLVHCKMGISRSASTVMAYIMKENGWPLEKAHAFVKKQRSCVRPNKGFMEQLQTYEGILHASSKRIIFRAGSQQDIPEEGEQGDGVENVQQGTFLGDSLFRQMSRSDWPDQNLTREEEMLRRQGYPGDYDLATMEPDLETDSRSADSMEESLPDMPSPMSDEPITFDLDASSVDASTRGTTKENNTQSGGALKAYDLLQMGDAQSTSRIKPDSSWIRLETPGESSTDPPGQESMEVGGWEDQPTAEFFIGARNTQSPQPDVETSNAGDGRTMPVSPPPKIVIDDPGVGQSATGFEGSGERQSRGVEMGVHQYYSREQIPWSPGKVANLRQGFYKHGSSSPQGDMSVKSDSKTTQCETGSEDRGMMSEAALLEAVGNLQTAPMMSLCDSCIELSSLDMEGEEDGRPRSVYEREDIPLTPGTVRRTRQEIEERQKLYGDDCDQGLYGLKSIQRSSSLREERPSSRSRSSERRRTCTPIVSPPPERATESSEVLGATPVLILGNKIGESSTDDLEEEMEVAEGGKEEAQNVTVYTFGEETVPVESGMVRRHKAEIESKRHGLHQRTLSGGSTSSLASCDSCDPTGRWTPPQASPPCTLTTPEAVHAFDTSPRASVSGAHASTVVKNLWPTTVHHTHAESTKEQTSHAPRSTPIHADCSLPARMASREQSAWIGTDRGGVRPRAGSDGQERGMRPRQNVLWEKSVGASGRVVATKIHHVLSECAEQQEGDGGGVDYRPRSESQPSIHATSSHRSSQAGGAKSHGELGIGEAGRPSKDDQKTFSTPTKVDSSKATTPHTVTPHPSSSSGKKHVRKSNFDPETLAIIREIGSAFVSMPTKVEEETEGEGGSTSLVKHLVKNIEHQQRVPRPQRKIIVIDSSSSVSNGGQGKRRSQEGVDAQVSSLSGQQHSVTGSHTPSSPYETARGTDPVRVVDSSRSMDPAARGLDLHEPPQMRGLMKTHASCSGSESEQSSSHLQTPACGRSASDGKLSSDSGSSTLTAISSSSSHSASASSSRDQQPSVVRHLVGRFEIHGPHSDTSNGEHSLSNSESSTSASSTPSAALPTQSALSHYRDLTGHIPVLLEEQAGSGHVPRQSGGGAGITKTRSLDEYPSSRSESLSSSSGRTGSVQSPFIASQPPSSQPPSAQSSHRPRSAEQSTQYFPPSARPCGVRQPWEGEGDEEGEPKVRRLHGKSHPLTRLQPSGQRQGTRPFSSSM